MFSLCSPSLVYLFFSILQVFFDIKNKMYNTVFMKIIVIIVITILLNILCQRNQTLIAWMIVFIPFIFMSVIVGILLFIFKLDPKTGTINTTQQSTPPPPISTTDVYNDASGNIIVFDPYYNPNANPVYYKYPNIIIPKPPPPPPSPYTPETKTISSPNTSITFIPIHSDS